MFTPREFQQVFLIEGQILQCCGPLFFSKSSEFKPTNVARNATFGLVDTGQRKILVTCHHVVEDFLEFRRECSEAKMGILLGDNIPVELHSNQLICSDAKLDLATFDMHPIMSYCEKRKFYPLNHFSAPPLKPKDILAFVGYIGEGRCASPMGISFEYEAFGVSVADVSGDMVAVDISRTKMDLGTRATAPVSNGGISGGPCFQLFPNGCLRLVAFATSEAVGTLRLTHAACLKSDGTIQSKC